MSIFISIYIVTSFPLGVRDKGANGRFKSQIFNAQIIDKISTNYKKDLKFASAAIIIESLQLLYILCIYSSDASLSRSRAGNVDQGEFFKIVLWKFGKSSFFPEIARIFEI